MENAAVIPKYKTAEYRIFKAAKSRCENPNLSCFANYGGRGIRFLFRDFDQFFASVGPRPQGMTLERLDNDGHYEPGNVEWATREQQNQNQRKRLRLEQFSDRDLLLECRKRGIDKIQDEYLSLEELFKLILNSYPIRKLWRDNIVRMTTASGSSHNHQAWDGGYQDHIVETMNIACQIYRRFKSCSRPMPFTLSDALLVMFLHDLEKPWKHLPVPNNVCLCGHAYPDHDRINPWSDAACRHCTGLPRNCNMYRHLVLKTKEDRRAFRDGLIEEYGILLSDDQKNALKYVEGIPDSEYKP